MAECNPQHGSDVPKDLFPWRSVPTASGSLQHSVPWLALRERAATPAPVSGGGLLLLQIYNWKHRKLEQKHQPRALKHLERVKWICS